ncbi:unnamed protein product [Spirodela intermedia]|uniref:HTH myb-type domain-containing protein n=1 Tax=Spirodela intermedia TaxID=51605 RepID=A0A7I8IJJ2_SPIIN|nr:unnamed protein product [Spirodela intermedia]CAA6658049.1 unnamed protein product [Spirodela intermedia]
MKEGWKRRGMRQYNRSEKPRFRWTEELHDRFLEAIRSLGGHERATPKQILLLMREKSMSISHVKSHLQKLRPRGKIPKSIHPGYYKPPARRAFMKPHLSLEKSPSINRLEAAPPASGGGKGRTTAGG